MGKLTSQSSKSTQLTASTLGYLKGDLEWEPLFFVDNLGTSGGWFGLDQLETLLVVIEIGIMLRF